MTDYGRAIKRPFTDVKTLIIGIVLSYLAILLQPVLIGIIPAFLLAGYYLRSAETASRRDFILPEFKDWGGLLVKGIVFTIITIVYMIPALIVFILSAGLSFGAVAGGLMSGNTTSLAAAGGGMLAGMGIGFVGLILAIIAAYLLPIAVIRYAVEGSFGAAFHLGTVIHKALSVKYFVTWLVMGVFVSILAMIIGFVFGLLVFPAMAAYYTAIGEVYPEV